jgi:hypothetical protein
MQNDVEPAFSLGLRKFFLEIRSIYVVEYHC